MSYGDELVAGLGRLRGYAEQRMWDECVVEYQTGRTVQDETTGAEEPEWATRFTSKCWVSDPGYADSDREVAGRREAVGTAVAKLPWDMPAVEMNDRLRITAVHPLTNPRLLGRTFYLSTDHVNSQSTRTKLVMKEDPWT